MAASRANTCRRRYSKAKRQALRWLNIMAEASLHLTLFLQEDDFSDYLLAKDLLQQLAREVMGGGG